MISKVTRIAVTTRVLFNLEYEHKIFKEKGLDAFHEYQKEHISTPLEKGVGFDLVDKLLKFNTKIGTDYIQVAIISRNDPFPAGARVMKSVEFYGLPISQFFFTGGTDITRYLHAYDISLFLSLNSKSVATALSAGLPAAQLVIPTGIVPSPSMLSPIDIDTDIKTDSISDQLRVAFDGDSVLFSDEAQAVYDKSGLHAFREHEELKKDIPLPDGPLKPFLTLIANAQKICKEKDIDCPFRTYLATSRGDTSSYRVMTTFEKWGIHTDEMFMLSGVKKTPILKTIAPHIFLDDNRSFVEDASLHGIPSACVSADLCPSPTSE